MKLIIREYLSSLRERGELDAVLPDLLSQMGLNVYSRPGRGTRQDGVDVGRLKRPVPQIGRLLVRQPGNRLLTGPPAVLHRLVGASGPRALEVVVGEVGEVCLGFGGW